MAKASDGGCRANREYQGFSTWWEGACMSPCNAGCNLPLEVNVRIVNADTKDSSEAKRPEALSCPMI